MSQQNLLFIISGVILIGIALLTEYVSTNYSSTWTMANNDVPGSVNQPVVISNNNIFDGPSNGGSILSHIVHNNRTFQDKWKTLVFVEDVKGLVIPIVSPEANLIIRTN
jgi:hypothetical protein